MRKLFTLMIAIVAGHIPGFAVDWTLIQDRLNNPTYDGPSGLQGEVLPELVHIYGVNSDTPINNGNPELFWPGMSAESMFEFSSLNLEASVTLGGSGSGFMYGITLWESRSHYIMYGLDCDQGVPYLPSKWEATSDMPNWTVLAGPISNPNGLHDIKIKLTNGVTKFWFDDVLLDTTDYGMSSVKLRLGAFARARGDAVDATYSSVNVTPEPTAMAAIGLGLAGLIIRRKRT